MPGIATAENAELFKMINTSHAQYIQEVFKGVELFGQISETATVPLSVPSVTNKKTTSIADFARGVELSKNLFDDKHIVSSILLSKVSQFFPIMV